MQLLSGKDAADANRGHHSSEISSARIFRSSHGAENLRHRSGGKAGFRRRRIRPRRAGGNRAASASPGGQLSLVGIWTGKAYFVECNETLSLASDQMALIEPEDRLLRAGAWHVPLFVRGHRGPGGIAADRRSAAIAREGKCADRARAPVPHRRRVKSRRTPRKRSAAKSSRAKRK